ncbi:transporter, EamA family protein, partial [Clostridium botulinum Af84]
MKIARIQFLLSMLIVGSIGLFVRSIPFSSPNNKNTLLQIILPLFFCPIKREHV